MTALRVATLATEIRRVMSDQRVVAFDGEFNQPPILHTQPAAVAYAGGFNMTCFNGKANK